MTRKLGKEIAQSSCVKALAAPPFAPADGVRAIDAGIEREVRILYENGVETFESCEGGEGHAFYEPTVRFFGGQSEGLRAVSTALAHGLKVSELRRYWTVQNGELTGPHWEMTFVR